MTQHRDPDSHNVIFISGLISLVVSALFAYIWASGLGWHFHLYNRSYPFVAVVHVVACPVDAPCYYAKTSRVIGTLEEIETAMKTRNGYKTPTDDEVELACKEALTKLKKEYPKTAISPKIGNWCRVI